ncbi:MAG: non-ribosomal peptide synthetase, partial [Candidatus Binatia bacterium]
VMRHTNMSHMCAHDRLVMFRASFRAYLYALLNGATYYPVDLHQDEAPELAEWLIEEKITVYRAAVSAFRSFAGALKGTEQFSHLRLILLFGEPVYHTDVELYRRQFADRAILAGTLGCMEFDDYAYFFVDGKSPVPAGVLPGGYPTAEAEILLLDDYGRPVGPGEIGEIAIKSRYNPVGYWRRADLTQAKFLGQGGREDERIYLTGDLGRMGPDGCLFHQGRRDFEVKIHGYRVDVGEVETVLTEIEGVKQAVVVGWEDNPGNKRLIAYIVPDETQMATVTELRRILSEKLPDYMVPSVFIPLSTLPLTATGKVDRRALPPPDRTRPLLEISFVAPRTPVEEKLAVIWAEVLGLDRVGVRDSFLELGGDSLSATQIVARVSSEFKVRVALRLLFDAPTIAEMASVIAECPSWSRVP